MGKGDRRSKRGKINNGSFGKSRPHKVKKKKVTTGKSRVATAKRGGKK